MRKVYYIKQTPSGRVFDAVNGIVIALLMFLMIYPFWNMLILSFNDGTDDLFLRLQGIPRRCERRLLSLFQHRVVQT